MKLLKSAAYHLASDGGNVKEMTVMGDAAMERFSDRGSIPLSSTIKGLLLDRITIKARALFVSFYVKTSQYQNFLSIFARSGFLPGRAFLFSGKTPF